MQLSLALDAGPMLVPIRDRLLARYGPQRDAHRLDPVSQLVLAILSSRTRDEVALAVFDRLRERYGAWDRLARADPDEVERVIAPVTFAEARAGQIPRALARIESRTGALDLRFLGDWPEERALAWLAELPGCGMRNAAAVLGFSTLRGRTLSVDTHLLRIGRRLGLLPPAADTEAAHRTYLRLVPDAWEADDLYELHWLLKAHGKKVCTHAAPACGRCPLADLCPRKGLEPGPGAATPQVVPRQIS